MIDVRLYFINSIKSQDINLECLEESNLEDDLRKIPCQKANLMAMVKALLKSSLLSVVECKLHFSTSLLEATKVIPSGSMFDRRLIRLNTALLYKQNKFNLLREDTAGYSALINDIVIGSIDSERDKFGKLQPTPLDCVPKFLDIISSHIGNFHLDPNRVLDILLDLFIKEVLFNYTFWVELFKQSLWIRQLSPSPMNGDDGDGRNQRAITSKHGIVMAHLLGFKLENYQLLEKTNVPVVLYYTCALLINSGLIRLGDLLPHLTPNEEHMDKLKDDYMEHMNKEIKTNSAGMLAQYGVLGEEGTTAKTTTAAMDWEGSDDMGGHHQTYDANDVVELVKAMLSIGDLLHSEEILAKYTKLCDMYPVLAHYIYRLSGVVLESSYRMYVADDLKARSTYFLECAQQSELSTPPYIGNDSNNMPTSPKFTTCYVLDCLRDSTRDLAKMQVSRFFYTGWSEQLDTATSYNQLLTQLTPIMRLAGYRTYLAPHLVHKLLLTLLALFERGEAAPGSQQRLVCNTMIREFLLPAVAFSGNNPGLATSVWELLDLLTLQERYCLYGEWVNDFYNKSIEAKLLKTRVERNVRSVMRRVSKNHVRRCGRDLGKLAHSNPTIVFSVMLGQIQAFDNLAPYMADACRYMGNFSYDILGYLMTEKWTGSQGTGRMKKLKLKEDGITSSWLRALSVFSGLLFKKQGIDPTPLIRYMNFRLQHDDSVADLVLFNEFITKICGIEIIGGTLTDNQVTSSGCSITFKTEAFAPLSNDNKKATKKVIARLKNTLKKDGAALELSVLLHRLSESCSSQQNLSTWERATNLTLIQQTILQYHGLLTTIFEQAEYSALVPSVDRLYRDYGLPYPIVMQILRPKTRYLLQNGMDFDTKYDDSPHALQPLIQATRSMMQNDSIFEYITPEFFVIFWQLDLYDIHCPVKHYEAAMKRYTDTINKCQDPRSSLNQTNRPSAVSKMERHAQVSLDALKQELQKHKQNVEDTMKMLKALHSRWFVDKVDPRMLARCVLQHCLYPRSITSEADAVYCYKFAMLIHQLNVNNFSSLILMDQILCNSLPAALITFTDYETTIHARFLYKAFSKMSQWYKDKTLFDSEAHGAGLIGFQQNWIIHKSSQPVSKKELLSHTNFVKLMSKWHHYSSQYFEQALLSGDSHQIRNAFLILRQFIPHFPAICEHGNALMAATKVLATYEKRDNLKVLARSYLRLIEKNKSRWVTKNAFMGLSESEPPTKAVAVTPSSSSKQDLTSPSRPKSASPQQLYDGRERHVEKLAISRNITSPASLPSNKTASALPSKRKKAIQDDIDPRLLSRSTSMTGAGTIKRLRSTDIENTGNNNNSSTRPYRSDYFMTPSSCREQPPRRTLDREANIAAISITREGGRLRDQARNTIHASSVRSTQSSISLSAPSHSSAYINNPPPSSAAATGDSSRGPRQSSSKNVQHRSSSRDQHHHHDKNRSRSSRSFTASTTSSSSTILPTSLSIPGRKRSLEKKGGSSYGYSSSATSEKGGRSDQHPRKQRRVKSHSDRDYRDRKHS